MYKRQAWTWALTLSLLAESGHFYVMHRFDLDAVAFARRMRDRDLFVSLSSGVKPADYAMIDRLIHGLSLIHI